MSVFSYKAIDQNGGLLEGTVEGADLSFAYDSVEAAGLYVIEIKETNAYLANISRKLQARKIKRKDIIEFASNLSVMLRAGMPITTAIADIADTTDNKHFKRKIDAIRRSVEFGSKFSDAIAGNRDVFPDVFVRIVLIGEETGGLDKSLADVATHLQKMEDLTVAIKRALIYPIFTIITTSGALLFWLIYVLPQIMVIFKDMKIKLPLFTRVLIHVSDFTKAYWYLILLSPVLFFILIKILSRKKKALYYIDMSKIKLPIIKQVVYNKLLALFTEQLRILTVAGIPITRSFEIAAEMIGNQVFSTAIDASMQEISAGSMISEAMSKHKVFPPMVTRMIQIGETSGTLDGQFAYLSEYYLKRLDDVSEKLGKMIEPIVIAVLGLMFSFIIVGLLFPMYDLISQFGK